VLFAVDLVLQATSEYDLQRSVYNLNTVTIKYKTQTSTEKTIPLVFEGKETVPSKICIDDRILRTVNKFTYLEYTLSYQEVDIQQNHRSDK